VFGHLANDQIGIVSTGNGYQNIGPGQASLFKDHLVGAVAL
jgi:hypothetical protein